MADFDSSLPVRTENDGDVVAKIADSTVPSQQLTVNADGSINVTDNGGSLTVDGVDFDIRDLDAAQDNVAISDGTDTLAINPDGSIDVGTTLDKNYGAVGANTLRTAAQIGNATGAADFGAGATGAQTLRVEANQGEANAVADAWPMLLTDGVDTVAVNTDGSINVVIADATPGTPINNYNTAAAVAGGASSNHDYTVTALKTFYFNQVEASASGKMKIEVQIETAVASGVFNTRWVQFNSTAETNMVIHIDNPIAVAAGVRVRIIRTNRDNQSQDVYSTISGYELP